jgi:hypothetical protein
MPKAFIIPNYYPFRFTRVFARGDGLLKKPGFVRSLFRHPNPCAGTSRGQRSLPQRGERLSPWELLVKPMNSPASGLKTIIPAAFRNNEISTSSF